MSIAFLIYIVGIVDPLSKFLGTVAGLCWVPAITIGTMWFFHAGINKEEATKARTSLMYMLRRTIPIFLGLSFLAIAIPSSKTLAAMVIVPQLAESEVIEKGYERLKLLTDEWIEELRPPKKEETSP